MYDGFSVSGGGKVNSVDLIPSPLSHNAPFHCAVQGILSASHQVLLTKFDAELFLQLIQQYRCTFAYMVPTTMKRVWDLPESVRLSYDVSSLGGIFHMAAPCPPWLKESWCNWLGPQKIHECYGPTEATALTMIRGDEWLIRPKIEGLNLVGKPAYGEIKILDPETKEELPPGTLGEVWMRHHERRITYYYRGAENTADNSTGWETVGDIGMLDEDGYVHLGDRKKDMVLIAGANVYPAEVEAALEANPLVKSAVVVGVPDDDLGNVLHAVIYTGGAEVNTEDLKAFLKDRLSYNKIPRGFTFSEEHVRGEDGKARRSHIAESVVAKIDAEKHVVKKKRNQDSTLRGQDSSVLTAQSVSGDAEPLNFSGRVAIVTGAGTGLGREYAMLLASRGAKVVVNDLGTGLQGSGSSTAKADDTVDLIRHAGGEAVANYDSVTDGHSIVKTALDTYGRVDILVNNAGILRDSSFRKMSDDDWDKVYQVHLKGAYSVTHAAWPHMEKNQFGRIVNITSSTGLYGSFGQANYAAMKSAALGLTFTLALEGKKRNIRANAIAPLAASRMMETVRSKDDLDKLPLKTVPNLVAYLCHDQCECTAGVFELGGYWISRLGWRRSKGARFPAGFSLEDVAARFQEISSFDDAEFPDEADSGEAHSMMPPAARL
jgi:NAD(P)-dependent dehydrogenase (short-subunit alcohol dehydrogenase family)